MGTTFVIAIISLIISVVSLVVSLSEKGENPNKQAIGRLAKELDYKIIYPEHIPPYVVPLETFEGGMGIGLRRRVKKLENHLGIELVEKDTPVYELQEKVKN